MIDSYQPIYDAVRSRISNGDIGAAVESAFRDANLGHYAMMAAENFRMIMSEYERPCVVFKPILAKDGNAWLAVLGDLPTGVVGCGDCPDEAMRDFDKAWYRKTAKAQDDGEGRDG